MPKFNDKDKRFDKVKHKDHNPNDKNCLCVGCIQVCQDIVDEFDENG